MADNAENQVYDNFNEAVRHFRDRLPLRPVDDKPTVICQITDILRQIAEQKLAGLHPQVRAETELAMAFGKPAWIDPNADLTFR